MPVSGQTVYPKPPASTASNAGSAGYATAGIIGIDSIGAPVVFVSYTNQAGSIV
jgi:hypothetical protein